MQTPSDSGDQRRRFFAKLIEPLVPVDLE